MWFGLKNFKSLGKIGTAVPAVVNPIVNTARNTVWAAKDALFSILNLGLSEKLETKGLRHRLWDTLKWYKEGLMDILAITPFGIRKDETVKNSYKRTFWNTKKVIREGEDQDDYKAAA